MRIAKQVHSSLIRVARFYSSSRAEEEKLCTYAIGKAKSDNTYSSLHYKAKAMFLYRTIKSKAENRYKYVPKKAKMLFR
jgi:hypothetical protein